MQSTTFVREWHPAPTDSEHRARLLIDPGFGRVFTDHMVSIRHSRDAGWHDAKVHARRPLAMDPACAVLHYAQEIFEGLKAYRTADGDIALFRPDQNARRFLNSAARLAMPSLPEPLFVEAVEQLTHTDQAWIPDGEGSLYLRPFMIAMDAVLGAKTASEHLFMVIASPVVAYFHSPGNALRVWVSADNVRATAGGTGAAKCGGNYAASLLAQQKAVRRGCDQAVFLDAAEHRWIEEMGSMNLFFCFEDGSLLTPPLNGNILPGITRASLITLARDANYEVREEPYSVQQWRDDSARGLLVEAFACGTAAGVVPIGQVCTPAGQFVISDGAEGSRTRELRRTLVDLQRGRADDPRRWLRRLL